MHFFSGSMQNSGTSGKKRDCPAKSGMVGRFVDRRDQVNVCVFSLTEMVHRREALFRLDMSDKARYVRS